MTEVEAGARRSALFVDFDNIFCGLRTRDRAAAESFATNPQRWLDWLARSADLPSAASRRFLLRVCYLNPDVYSRYRPHFVRSGFRVVDCPPLTAQGKTSADITIVLDVVDALAHETRYDEFVLASADADFTPLLHRLRSHDRRTTLVTTGPASAACRAVCDSVILPDRFAGALGPAEAAGRLLGSTSERSAGSPWNGSAAPGDDGDTASLIDAAVAAVRRAVADAPVPLTSGYAAQAAIAVHPTIAARGWAGAGSFSAFVARRAPELGLTTHRSPGYVYDRTRHSPADVPGSAGSDLSVHSVANQISRVLGAPRLTQEQYRVLFDELARDLADRPLSLTETGKAVRDRTATRGVPVSRTAISFVLKGLVHSGHALTAASRARDLADAFVDNLRTLCAKAGVELRDDDSRALREWLAEPAVEFAEAAVEFAEVERSGQR
jgi:hypothetical protein